MSDDIMRVLNLGAGVQSSTILFMCVQGELPMPDHAIFADTGDEPDEVYSWLQYLKVILKPTPIKLHIVTAGTRIQDTILDAAKAGKRVESAPFFAAGKDGRAAPINRSCTGHWKIAPIRRKIKELLDLKPRARYPKSLAVEQWLGISWDEMTRMKHADKPYFRFWHPLIEEPWQNGIAEVKVRPITREGCYDWLRLNNWPVPPRSACRICPYHSNAEWRHIRQNKKEWQYVCEFDQQLREYGFLHGMNGGVYLHRSLRPLADAPIDGPQGQLSLFDEECAGVCGT